MAESACSNFAEHSQNSFIPICDFSPRTSKYRIYSPDSLVRVCHPRPDKVLNVLRRRLVAALELHEGPGEVPHALDRVANHGAVGNGRVRVDHRLEGLFE